MNGVKPNIIIASFGKSTRVFLDGKEIGEGVGDLIYSARNDEGELSPTLKLLKVDLRNFTWEGATFEEELVGLGVTEEGIRKARESLEAKRAALSESESAKAAGNTG